LKIELAGFNVDTGILRRLNRTGKEVLTPETFSAAYARISRSPEDITAIRKKAVEDVERSRKSNKAIIFEMGHHSVAEHAVFNFDISQVSRLAMEEIEKLRLTSYTEKSQRYVTLKGDYVIPGEIRDPKDIRRFQKIIRIQNQFYFKAYSALKTYIFDHHPHDQENRLQKRLLEGWAKEDARYILSLATQGQLGMTINARNVEHLLRRSAMSDRSEVREVGEKIFSILKKIAPSIILFPEPSALDLDLKTDFRTAFHSLTGQQIPSSGLQIIDYTPDADDRILAAFLSIYRFIDYEQAVGTVKKLKPSKKNEIFKLFFKNMEFFDSPPREFELPDITFQAVISASNFAQLKRHRMATLLCSDYRIELENTIPDSLYRTGLQDEFSSIIAQTNRVYDELKSGYGRAADYILTNSHRRMVIMKMNLRELYHFIRLRDDRHAQWDIKSLARDLAAKTKEIMPFCGLLLCGKSDFVDQYEKIFKSRPKFDI
jgi:flavin-dependent thymidylate synthase